MGEDCDMSETGVRVSGNGDVETLVGHMGFEGKFDEEGDMAANGEDIMVEVLGSEVFFDGVCSSGSGANSNEEEEAGLDGSEDVGGGGGGGGSGGGDDLVEGDIGVLGGSVVWNDEIESEVDGSLVIDTSVHNVQTEDAEVKASIAVVEEGPKDGALSTDNSLTTNHEFLENVLQVGEATADHVCYEGTQAPQECEDTVVEQDVVQVQADTESLTQQVQTYRSDSLTEYEPVTDQHPVQETEENADIKANEPVNVSESAENGGTVETPDQVEITQTDNFVHMAVDPECSHQETGGTENVNPEIEDGEKLTDANEPKQEHEVLSCGSSRSTHQANYQLPAEKEGQFFVSDLVWGKVKSFPWWPGQIFDPSDSSEKGMKYRKKDSYLVAYFDNTFAWTEPSQLRPFRTHFSQIEKQTHSEAFHNAVACALDEVSRRVQLGLACSCILEDAYEKIKYQIVENSGVRPEASKKEVVDTLAGAESFDPCTFLAYVKGLAQLSSDETDELHLVIAKAQLLAFYRLKGYSNLPEFQLFQSPMNNDSDALLTEGQQLAEVIGRGPPVYDEAGRLSYDSEKMRSQDTSSRKRKHNLRDISFPTKKERSLSELMVETKGSANNDNGTDGQTDTSLASPSSKRLKPFDPFDEETVVEDSRKSTLASHVSNSPRQSFKIGDCIRRAASQMTGSSPSIIKAVQASNQRSVGNDYDVPVPDEDLQGINMTNPIECSSASEILSQLRSTACNPMKGNSSSGSVISFFSDFRKKNLWVDKSGGGRKRKAFGFVSGSPETFEFEDMKDSYWTDRVIQNGSEEKISRKDRKVNYQPVVLEPQDSTPKTSRVYSRRRFSNSNYKPAGEKPSVPPERPKQDNSPTELIMIFPGVNLIPSETKLNNMFRHFGPLKEFETEVDRDTNRARVVFKRCSDAEVACSSAGKFNIFGSTIVHYEISYTPSVSYRAAPIAPPQNMEVVTMQDLEFASSHDLEFVTMQELEDATMHDMHYAPTRDLDGATMQDLEFPITHDLDFATHHLEIPTSQVVNDVTMQHMEVANEYEKSEVEQEQQITDQDLRVDMDNPEIAARDWGTTPYKGKIPTGQDMMVPMEDLGDGNRQYQELALEDVKVEAGHAQGSGMPPFEENVTTIQHMIVPQEDPGVGNSQYQEAVREELHVEARHDPAQFTNQDLGIEMRPDEKVDISDLGGDAMEITEVGNEDVVASENAAIETAVGAKGAVGNLEVDAVQDHEGASQDMMHATADNLEFSTNDVVIAKELEPEFAKTHDPDGADEVSEDVTARDLEEGKPQESEAAPENMEEGKPQESEAAPENMEEGKPQESEAAPESMEVEEQQDPDVARTEKPEVVTMQDPEPASEVEENTRSEDPEVSSEEHVIRNDQESDFITDNAEPVVSERTDPSMEGQEVPVAEHPEDAA